MFLPVVKIFFNPSSQLSHAGATFTQFNLKLLGKEYDQEVSGSTC
jgi:hypothetical protein